ncbi:MAG: 6-phosphogluconolactonase [Actinobacteria bacterium]|nr:6-phosphogluconolactonase [Actinomycetota bacterium]MCL5446934.1 6-phosphogluconolactonase [Actinomycetota bacterium]
MRRFTFDRLSVIELSKPGELAEKAALAVDQELAKAVKMRGEANAVFATGDTQVAVLDELVRVAGLPSSVDWSKVRIFHLDELLGIGIEHPASFARFIKEKLVDRHAVSSSKVFYMDGTADPSEECSRYSNLLKACTLDVCIVGIGVNCHAAFNEPGSITDAEYADLLEQNRTERASLVKVVRLEDDTRLRQYRTGGFEDFDSVPRQAITLSMPAILGARRVIAVCSGARKASVVQQMLEGEVSPLCPASLLRLHSNANLLLDGDAASLLPHKPQSIRRAGLSAG